MNPSNFDPSRWDHWLLLINAIALSIWILWQCQQWQRHL